MGAGIIVRPWLPTETIYPWKAAALFAAMMTMAAVFLGDHPFPRLGPANRVTMIRAMLVALIGGLIGEPGTPPVVAATIGLTALVTVLDGVDGWLARRSGVSSAFGARADMETDALLVLVLSVLIWQHGKAGGWILVGGLLRYAFAASGWLLPWMAGQLSPTLRARAINVCHVVGLSVALAPFVRPPASSTIVAATLALLTWSFAVDVQRLRRQSANS